MSFWRTFGFNTVSAVETILDRESFTLEDLLDEEELLQECKNQNKRLLDLYVFRLVVLFFFLLFLCSFCFFCFLSACVGFSCVCVCVCVCVWGWGCVPCVGFSCVCVCSL
jgi:hypothetical protein